MSHNILRFMVVSWWWRRELFDFSRRVARRAPAQSDCDEHRRCIMGLLLAAVAIQFMRNGFKAFHTGLISSSPM